MSTKYNTNSIKVNNLSSKLPETFCHTSDNRFSPQLDEVKPFKKKGRPLNKYDWADRQFYDGKIPASELHTLKGILARAKIVNNILICDSSIPQINKSRTKSASKRFAQSNSVTERTIMRHIVKLEKAFPDMLIVDRYKNGYDAWNIYYIRIPAEYLVEQRSDIMSLPIISSTSEICNINHNHIYQAADEYYSSQHDNDFIKKPSKQRAAEPIGTPKEKMPYLTKAAIATAVLAFNHDETMVYEKLIGGGTYENVAVGWVQKVPLYVLHDLIQCSKALHVNMQSKYICKCVKNWLLLN